jgi:thioredoxin 1
MAAKITKDNFEELVIGSKKPVLADFWAAWCGPCRMLGPVIDELAEEQDEIFVCKINVDEEPQLAARFNVSTIPTVIAFKDGKVYNKSIGVVPKERLLALVK